MIRGAARAFGLSLAIACSALAGAADEDARIALVVGNAAYDEPGWALTTPPDDARAIAAALEAAGFDVELAIDVDHEAFDAALRRFGERLERAQAPAGFFYFAGRAIQSSGALHLLAVDIVGDSDPAGQAPDIGLVLRRLRAAEDGRSFLIVDACHAPADPEVDDAEACGPVRRRGGGNAVIAFSADAGQVATEGLYAAALAEALRAPALDAESVLAQAARVTSAESGGAQTPRIQAGGGGELFYFHPPSEADYDDRVAEAIRWDFARRAATADAYRGYIAAHPDGRFVEDALRAIAASERPTASPTDDTATPAASSGLGVVLGFAAPAPDPKFRPLDPENLLVVDTTKGGLLIELLPDLAPEPAARIRELARERYFDGAPFERVIDGLYAEVRIRAPSDEPALPPRALLEPANRAAAPVSIADRDRGRVGVYASGDVDFGLYKGVALASREAEPDEAWSALCPGVAVVGRREDGSEAASVYVMLGESPGMDSSAQPWGRVIDGLETLYDLALGDAATPGFEPDRITRVRVASQLSASEREDLYDRVGAVLDESGPGFAEFTASLARSLGREPRVCEIRLPTVGGPVPAGP